MTLKRCPKCKEVKEKSAQYFHKNKIKKDGLNTWCKLCKAEADRRYHIEIRSKNHNKEALRHKKYRAEYHEKIALSRKMWKKTEKGKASIKKYQQSERGKLAAAASRERMRKKYPERFIARSLASQNLIPGDHCEFCNIKETEARLEMHHRDYSKPLEVVTLCTKHHRLADRVRKINDNNKQK